MNDRHLAYFDLLEAFRQPGCPVCRCVGAASRRYLETLGYEHVNDPEVRRRLRASWGLCNWHTGILADLPGSPFAAAVIHEDLLRTGHRTAALGARSARVGRGPRRWLARLAGDVGSPALARLYRRRPPCPACVEAARVEARAVDALAVFAGELAFQRAYEASDGLCVPHTVQAVERAAGRPQAETLVRLTVRRWEVLRRAVERFVAKHDHRNTEPFSDDEVGAWRRALATIAGEPGLFGDDRMRAGGGPGARPQPPRAPALAPGPSDPASAADREAFERRKLELRIEELTRQLGETSSRAAALHYRLSRVAEDRNVLELNLAGERGGQPAGRARAPRPAAGERAAARGAGRPAQLGPAVGGSPVNECERRVFEPCSGEERLAALRAVLASREPAKIDGVFVEYHWARMILELWEDMGPEARVQLAETPVPRVPELIRAWSRGRRARPDLDSAGAGT